MTRWMAAVFLLPALPLLGVWWNPVAVLVLAGISFGGLFGAVLTVDVLWARQALLLQGPLALLLSVVAFHLAKRLVKDRTKKGLSDAGAKLTAIKTLHSTLKTQVAQAELEENRSLQIYGLAKSLAEALSLKDMIPKLSTGIQKVFGSQEFLLYSIDEKGAWALLHRRGSWAKEPPLTRALPAESVFYFPPQTQEVVPVQYVPILGAERTPRVNGVLFLKCASERPGDDLLRVGVEFGQQLGLAISKVMLFNQMEMHSRLDGLTGVLRRQAFMDRLNEEIKKAQAFHSTFSIFMVDIDHFKAINDGHGHAAGDAVLARAGHLLKTSVYETDVVGRYGGEEFIVLLPRAEWQGVARKADQLRQRFENDVVSSGFEQLRVTVSIGVAHFPQHGRTAEELISKADAALYQAKETGRNRVVAA